MPFVTQVGNQSVVAENSMALLLREREPSTPLPHPMRMGESASKRFHLLAGRYNNRHSPRTQELDLSTPPFPISEPASRSPRWLVVILVFLNPDILKRSQIGPYSRANRVHRGVKWNDAVS